MVGMMLEKLIVFPSEVNIRENSSFYYVLLFFFFGCAYAQVSRRTELIVFWMLMCSYFRSIVSVMNRGKQLTLLVLIRYHFFISFFNSISVLANLPKLMGLPQRRDQIKSRRASNHFLNIKACFITGLKNKSSFAARFVFFRFLQRRVRLHVRSCEFCSSVAEPLAPHTHVLARLRIAGQPWDPRVARPRTARVFNR